MARSTRKITAVRGGTQGRASKPMVGTLGSPTPEPTPVGVGYDVVLRDAGAGKLNVVKIVKTLTGMGLKEAKDLVDATGVVKENVSQEEAEAIKAQLVEAGATVEVRAHGS